MDAVNHRSSCRAIRLRQEQGEFVAAQPGQRIRRTHLPANAFGDFAQHPVAGTVPEPVIDGLEIIQVYILIFRYPESRVGAGGQARCMMSQICCGTGRNFG